MASLGFNGVTIFYVGDILKEKLLCQSGSAYYLKHEVFLEENQESLMTDMEDTCQYVYWWNSYLYENQ